MENHARHTLLQTTAYELIKQLASSLILPNLFHVIYTNNGGKYHVLACGCLKHISYQLRHQSKHLQLAELRKWKNLVSDIKTKCLIPEITQNVSSMIQVSANSPYKYLFKKELWQKVQL
jgi:hypothetical protein